MPRFSAWNHTSLFQGEVIVTYIGPVVLQHLLTGRLESLDQAPRLDHQLMASRLATVLQMALESIDFLDYSRHGVGIAGPGGKCEVSGLRHVVIRYSRKAVG